MRVSIIGNSGSGKSTLAQQLAAAHPLTSLDLDTVAWESGTVGVPRSAAAAAADVRAFCETHDRWVTEGCYAGLTRGALEYSPILVFMDPGVDACLSNCGSRPWEPHKYASKEVQDGKLEFLLAWVREYYTRDGDLSVRAHQDLFDTYRGLKYRLAQQVDRTFIETLPLRVPGAVDDLATRFVACAVPAKEWTHWAHLVVGLWHVHRYGADEALTRLRSGIRHLNESHGGKNTETNGYHETITAAYVQLLSQFLANGSAGLSFPDRVTALLDSPLAAKRALSAYYSTERLMSITARAEWIEPDLAPLRIDTAELIRNQ